MTAHVPPPDISSLGRRIAADLPDNVLETYARLWQFETWLRRFVYIELRALLGDDWTDTVRGAERPREADQQLTHMPTAEVDLLSYCQLSELCRIITDRWDLFMTYLPPKDLWEAKIKEISQIRHRVAHFRMGHRDDLQRVVQLLRDLDKGFWCFCTSYNDPRPVLPPTDDPVTAKFLHLDPFPWSLVGDHEWARIGIADPEARFALTVEVLHRPWAKATDSIPGNPGRFYDVRIVGRHERGFDYSRFLRSSTKLHPHLAHVCLDNLASSIRVTIPTLLGADTIIRIIERLIELSQYCLTPNADARHPEGSVDRLAAEWPEQVLGPSNPLTFLDPAMPCSFFGV